MLLRFCIYVCISASGVSLGRSDISDHWSIFGMSRPRVFATMRLSFTHENRSVQWGAQQVDLSRHKRLIIPLNCMLEVDCRESGFGIPVKWMKNGELINDNTENMIRKEGSLTKLVIKNVTFDTEGHYTCTCLFLIPNATMDDSLQSSFEVIVQGTAITSEISQPQILTPIFYEFHPLKGTSSHIVFESIRPIGMEIKEFCVFPGNITVQLLSSDFQRIFSGITISSNPHLAGGGIWQRFLNLWSTEIEYHRNGTYIYVIQYRATNESWLNVSRQITVLPPVDTSSSPPQEVKLTSPDTFRVKLTLGRYYAVRFDAHLNSGAADVLRQSPPTCDLIVVPAASHYEVCGVLLSSGKLKDHHLLSFIRSPSVSEMSLKVVRSCAFRTRIWSYKRLNYSTKIMYMNAIEEGYEPLPGDQITFATSDGVRDSKGKYTNESITIQCRFPACEKVMVALCKQGTTMDCAWIWRDENGTFFSAHEFLKSSTNISVVELTSSTLALEIRLEKLELQHAGVYGCGEYKGFLNNRKLGSMEEKTFYDIWRGMHFVNFRLTVMEPKAPSLDDSQSAFKEIRMNGGEAVLYCPFTGSPDPLIIWKKVGKYLTGSENRTDIAATIELRTYTNKTSVTVRDIGTYECLARNRFGENSRRFNVKHDSPPASPLPIALSVTAAAILMAFAIAVVIWQRRRTKKALFKELAHLLSEPSQDVQLDDVLPLNEQANILPYNTNYEIDRDRFQLIKVIGDGEFGQVYRGELQTNENQRRYVAVKVPKNPLKPEHHQALIGELKIMIYLRPHANVLALIGACTNELEQRQRLFVLTEYCEKGSLLSYLQDHILDFESQAPGFGIQSLLDFAYQAANGMEHLATWRIIHRDLAVRNLLLTHRGVIKIADFGLSRQKETVYSYNKFLFRNVRLPVPWMAPESVTRYEYTHKSDVWSFGVVLWEIFSCGRVPFSNEDISGMEIITWLREGNRLPMPALATNEMFSLMLDCWASDPTSRPTFSQCKGRIARHLEDLFPSSYTSLLLLLSDSFCQMRASRHPSSTTLDQEIPIDPSADQQEEHVAIEMGSDFLVNLSDDPCSLSTPASFDYVTSAGTSEAGGEINIAFDEEEPENGYVTGGDNVLSVDAVFDQEEFPGLQNAPEDRPLLG